MQKARAVRHRAEMETKPGSREQVDFLTIEEADGRSLAVPVEIIAGARPGPRLVCAAGIHGDEIEGIVALQELAKKVEPADLSGTLVLIKIVNPAAFVASQRHTPWDDADLNRLFLNKNQGRFSLRHADRVLTEIVASSDFLFTLHGAGSGFVYAPEHVEVPFGEDDVCQRSLAAARAVGFERIYPLDWHVGVLPAAAVRLGIPSMEAELGGNGTTDERAWQVYVKNCLDLMRHLKMLDGAPPGPPELPPVVVEPLLTTRGGLWRRRVDVPSQVAAGALLGTVHDLQGNTIEELRADRACEIVGYRISSTVHAGSRVLARARGLRPGERPSM